MKLRSDLTLRQIGNEYIMVEPENGILDLSKVFCLNRSAAHLWSKLQGVEFNENDVAKILAKEYELTLTQAFNDGVYLIQKFRSANLLQ
ncbi:PqqD family protein [Sphingobacterium sp. HJSM2_6]|uniref:PqqD family protein n=1 Tax=Sphingobacterium sp. HJSM2_6 TaxID=3366264 RepID=UPI003BE7FFB8